MACFWHTSKQGADIDSLSLYTDESFKEPLSACPICISVINVGMLHNNDSEQLYSGAYN